VGQIHRSPAEIRIHHEIKGAARESDRTAEQIIEATASYYDVSPQEYVGFRSLAAGRELAAFLCRCWAGETIASPLADSAWRTQTARLTWFFEQNQDWINQSSIAKPSTTSNSI
jgi:hypothetical protein